MRRALFIYQDTFEIPGKPPVPGVIFLDGIDENGRSFTHTYLKDAIDIDGTNPDSTNRYLESLLGLLCNEKGEPMDVACHDTTTRGSKIPITKFIGMSPNIGKDLRVLMGQGFVPITGRKPDGESRPLDPDVQEYFAKVISVREA
ncbi:MAG: hypothetical protein ABIG30_00590 [Candidatus Aenigmatarchaeota archaeon]